MKIIDLLNKVLNKEDIPKKIKYNDLIYIFNEKYIDYYNDIIDYNYLFKDSVGASTGELMVQRLNDEVEIIEEDKKIEYLHFHDLIDTPTENEKY